MENQVVTFKEKTPEEIRQTILGNSGLVSMVQKSMGVEAFTEAAMQLIRQPGLMKCTQDSVLGGMLKAAIFNFRISPELGQCWLVPRPINLGTKDSPVWAEVATFQVGYKGWQELAFRSGVVESFDSGVVWSADSFDYEQGTSPFLKYKACANPNSKGSRTHVWASATMNTGRVVFNVVDIQEIERHRGFSKSQNIWNDHYDQMAKRIPMRYLCTLQLPKSDELRNAIESDGASIQAVGDTLKATPLSEIETIAQPQDQQINPELAGKYVEVQDFLLAMSSHEEVLKYWNQFKQAGDIAKQKPFAELFFQAICRTATTIDQLSAFWQIAGSWTAHPDLKKIFTNRRLEIEQSNGN